MPTRIGDLALIYGLNWGLDRLGFGWPGHQQIAEEAKAKFVRRKRKLNMIVRVVPQGTLSPNVRNPYARNSPSDRRSAMLKTVTRGLANIIRSGRDRNGPAQP